MKAFYHGGYYFVAPSMNIACGIQADDVSCAIWSRSYKDRPRPKSCEYGMYWDSSAVYVENGAVIDGICATQGWPVHSVLQSVNAPGTSKKNGASISWFGDTAKVPTISYGQAVRMGDFRCVVETSGVSCGNIKTKHGFKMSREALNIW